MEHGNHSVHQQHEMGHEQHNVHMKHRNRKTSGHEGHIENVTGWSVGERDREGEGGENREKDAAKLYDKLEQVILPMYYDRRDQYVGVMRYAIAFNGCFFNTQRMMQQYVVNAYFR